MAGEDKLPEHYWHDVFNRAWGNTLHRVGWDTTKAILATAVFIGSWILGGAVYSATGGFLIGILMLAPILFVCGVIQAQADMYRDHAKRQSVAPSGLPLAAPQTNHLATPTPDFEMWRHREQVTLLEAAQLSAGVRPSVSWGTRGTVNDLRHAHWRHSKRRTLVYCGWFD